MATSRKTKGNIDFQTNPSGRGIAVPHYVPGKFKQAYPELPRHPATSGQTGMPSTSMSNMASRFMNAQVMNDDDLEYFADIEGNPPYDLDRTYAYKHVPLTSMGNNSAGGAMFPELPDDSWKEDVDESLIREFVRTLLESEELVGPDDEESGATDEVNTVAAGGVSGVTLPLGMSAETPGKKRKKPHWQAYADSFGRAKKVK